MSSGDRASDYEHLLLGHIYRVAEPFRDFDGTAHTVGETWTYAGYDYFPYESGLTLYMRARNGDRSTIRIQGGLPAGWLERVELVSADQTLFCACDVPSWTTLAELDALVIMRCTECPTMIAMEPAGEGGKMIAVDRPRRKQIERALAMDPRAPVIHLIHTALACAAHPANLLVATKLMERPTFLQEVGALARSKDEGERIAALEVIGRIGRAPASIAEDVMYALRNPIDGRPDGDERLAVLVALYVVAADVDADEREIAPLIDALDGLSGDRAELIRKIGAAVLGKMAARDAPR